MFTACGIMHPRCCRPVAWKRKNSASRLLAGFILVHYTTSCNTQSSVPEDGQNNCPKHVELFGIINKPLLLHLVRCLYYLNVGCLRNIDVEKSRLTVCEVVGLMEPRSLYTYNRI